MVSKAATTCSSPEWFSKHGAKTCILNPDGVFGIHRIRAAEIRPGNRKVVHYVHVSVIADTTQAGSTSIESITALSQFLVREGTLTRVRADAPVVDNA